MEAEDAAWSRRVQSVEAREAECEHRAQELAQQLEEVRKSQDVAAELTKVCGAPCLARVAAAMKCPAGRRSFHCVCGCTRMQALAAQREEHERVWRQNYATLERRSADLDMTEDRHSDKVACSQRGLRL
jgi:hypothetical protein